MTEGGLMRRNNCLQCGRSFDGIRFNLTRRKFCGNDCAKAYIRAQGPARFWAKVDKTSSTLGCWLYTGFIKWDGYGWVARSEGHGNVRWMTAHRYAWILTHGEPPEEMHILHDCDIPACCNPAHLRLGTHQENMADQKARGRHVHGERTRRNKLTALQAAEIRQQYRRPSFRVTNAMELAARYGVSVGAIHAIARGDAWKITEPSPVLHPGRVRPRRAA
jgi:hypothetical protein